MKFVRLLKNSLALGLMAASLICAPSHAQTATGKTELLWLGQAGFRITSPGGKTIVIDPWLTGGPKTPAPYKTDISALGKVDLLLVTHAHVDHIGDAPALAKLNNTVLYGPADMVTPLITLGLLPSNLGHRFNKTGHVKPLPGIKVTAVAAEHSSLLVWNNPATGKLESHPAGEAVGYIIEMENGFKIWHMGDTGLFGDMKFINDRYQPDLILMPIGGNFHGSRRCRLCGQELAHRHGGEPDALQLEPVDQRHLGRVPGSHERGPAHRGADDRGPEGRVLSAFEFRHHPAKHLAGFQFVQHP